MAALDGPARHADHGEFPANALAVLANLFAARGVESDSPLAESAAAWLEVTDETSRALAAFPGLTLAESWELALAQFAESVRFAKKPAGALELNGWLGSCCGRMRRTWSWPA